MIRKFFHYATLSAYLCGTVISRVFAIREVVGSKTITIPDQSLERSVELQTGQTLPTVIALHFSISSLIQSNEPKNGCLHVIPIFPIEDPLPRLTAVILALILEPILKERED